MSEMVYGKQIDTLDDVREFYRWLFAERRVNFHPDDDFNDYINLKTKEPTFTHEEAEQLNRLMERCFEVCAPYGEDKVYALGNDVFWELVEEERN